MAATETKAGAEPGAGAGAIAAATAEPALEPSPSASEGGSASESPPAARAGPQGQASGKEAASAELRIRQGADGSFSLWSATFGEGFHSGRGALREARDTFLAPSQLERLRPGQRLTVVEVCVGTGTNLAVLLEGCAALGLALEWWGLELDPAPLELALAQPAFRGQWQPQTVAALEELSREGSWQHPMSGGRMLWGDARQTLPQLLEQRQSQVDLVWQDAFSPQHCPQLWTVEVLGLLAELLADGGRWISYCSAAAVREGLLLAHLNVVALSAPGDSRLGLPDSAFGPAAEGVEGAADLDEKVSPVLRADRVERADVVDRADRGVKAHGGLAPDPLAPQRRAWSGGTLASRAALAPSGLWRELSAMEQEHLASSAGVPYRDPSGTAEAAAIHACRREAQAASLARGTRTPSSAWRRRWGL